MTLNNPNRAESPIVSDIFEAKTKDRGAPRGYLGMSEIGRVCERSIWYSFRKFTPAPWEGRILLIFEMGDLVEQIILKGLRRAGYVVENAYPDKQLSFSDMGGFFSGHCDGVIALREPNAPKAILECKSANKNKFGEFCKNGVEKQSPEYYAQLQAYMGYSGLESALFMVLCKDNCDIYSERVFFNKEAFMWLQMRASDIIQTHDVVGKLKYPERPEELEQKSVSCQWCNYKTHCWEPKEAAQAYQACISCAFLKIGPDFKPKCTHQGHAFDLKNIHIACDDWKFVGRCPF